MGPSPVVKYLGDYLDSCLKMRNHISNKCRTAMCNIQRIRYIRKNLSKDACVTLMLGLVTIHLDFANALYACLPATALQQLQSVQNTTAKVVLNKKKYDSATLCLKELHWLQIAFRVCYKTLTLVFQCVKGEAPDYLKDLIVKFAPKCGGLRSKNDSRRLIMPYTKLKHLQ